jgi:hypothetical protein
VADHSHRPVIVHFPHPGTEHNATRMSRQPWNTNKKHRRKFLCSVGRHVDSNERLVEELLAFWGEWEAPSYVRKHWPKDGELPQFLQEPVWERPTVARFRQNTDPWVFGDSFRYSNCKQAKQKKLQRLPSDSVILFGSKRPGKFEFALDTVFVVGERPQKFSPANPPNTDEAFRICTIESLASGGGENTCGTSRFLRGCGHLVHVVQWCNLRGFDQRDVLVCPLPACRPRRSSLRSAIVVPAS